MRWRGAVLAVALFAIAPEANAQNYWWGGLGSSIPSGHTGDGLSAGMQVTGGVGWDLSTKGWSVQGEGVYSSNTGKAHADGLKMRGLLANVAYNLKPDADWQPFVAGGLGWMSSTRTGASSISYVAMQVSGGLLYKVSDKMQAFAEIRYLNVGTGSAGYTTTPITAGIVMPWGKK